MASPVSLPPTPAAYRDFSLIDEPLLALMEAHYGAIDRAGDATDTAHRDRQARPQ